MMPLFFDECEAIFAKRKGGGDRLLNTLLTEMERYEGIIMMATNRPLDLDEAMHMRIPFWLVHTSTSPANSLLEV
jgi:SpoVK/Ycf46/Vps4 family AAA+-type ATPase